MGKRSSIERVQASMCLTRPARQLLREFASYEGTSVSWLVEMLLDEHKGIYDGITMDNLNLVHEPQRRVFPEAITRDLPQRTNLGFSLEVPTFEVYEANAERLGVGISWVARVATLHGLALEMEAERFAPAVSTE